MYENKKEDYQVLIDEWIKDVNKEQTFEFKDYELRFFGDGKMVALLKSTPGKFYDYSALFSRNKEKGKIYYYDLFLYRPSPGAPLEVIR